jgi:hypothetical protein
MGPQFHETGYGRTFFEHQLPELIKSINQLANATREQNEILKSQQEQPDPKKIPVFGTKLMGEDK